MSASRRDDRVDSRLESLLDPGDLESEREIVPGNHGSVSP
jgi:hypothetical protein